MIFNDDSKKFTKQKPKEKKPKIDFAEFLAFLSRQNISENTNLEKQFEYFSAGQKTITIESMLNALKEIGEPAHESYYKEHVEKLFKEGFI